MPIETNRFEKVQVLSASDLREWLLNNFSQTKSYWLVTYKKSEVDKYVSRWEVLDELICFGWIDGIRRKLDDKRTMQLISQRKVDHWAQSYKDRAAKLIDEGRMHEAGFKTIEAAKQSGLWNFMEDVDKLIIPNDLEAALHSRPQALEFFLGLNPSSKRFVLRWIKLAKSDKTRKSRILKVRDLSAKGEKLPGS
jgi:uncharacterized protein YdeI (YjbR/CyaY-like superfamily)